MLIIHRHARGTISTVFTLSISTSISNLTIHRHAGEHSAMFTLNISTLTAMRSNSLVDPEGVWIPLENHTAIGF